MPSESPLVYRRSHHPLIHYKVFLLSEFSGTLEIDPTVFKRLIETPSSTWIVEEYHRLLQWNCEQRRYNLLLIVLLLNCEIVNLTRN